jgi:hypothetical protein
MSIADHLHRVLEFMADSRDRLIVPSTRIPEDHTQVRLTFEPANAM